MTAPGPAISFGIVAQSGRRFTEADVKGVVGRSATLRLRQGRPEEFLVRHASLEHQGFRLRVWVVPQAQVLDDLEAELARIQAGISGDVGLAGEQGGER